MTEGIVTDWRVKAARGGDFMHVVRRVSTWVLACVLLASVVPSAQDELVVSAKTWLGQEAETEAFLRAAEVDRLEPIGIGVTSPDWMYLAPGGLVERGVWKNLKPGIYGGFYESYKAEIAAYALDRLLGLQMVPPKVEKHVEGDLGMAMMEVTSPPTVSALGGFPTPPPAQRPWWTIQLIRAKMFDNLIDNRDPNEGNWMVDSAWNIILIDHSRAFTGGTEMQHELTQVDRDLWERMQQLDEAALTAALSEWVGDGATTPSRWSATKAVVPDTATFLAWPSVVNEPRSRGAPAPAVSRIPRPNVSAAT